MPNQPPAWVTKAQQSWSNTGSNRPPFALDPGSGQESVWDYPRPPIVVPDDRTVVVHLLDGSPLAQSSHALRLLETASPPTFYLPMTDIDMTMLTSTTGQSMCEWKGAATYFAARASAETSDQNVERAGTREPIAWTYPDVWEPFQALADHLAFYPGRVRASVDGETVRAQPGGFYGGWITSEVVGPFKGDPGTGGW